RSTPLQLLHSFPTRRSSDLAPGVASVNDALRSDFADRHLHEPRRGVGPRDVQENVVETAHRANPEFPIAPGVTANERNVRMPPRSEEHTSELQSRGHLVCRL